MTRKQRLLNQIHGDEADRIPRIGGWNLGVRNLSALAGISVEEYLKDPFQGMLRANICLGVDAMVPPIVPTDIDSIRDGSLQESIFEGVEPEALQERAEAIPATANEVLARFDAEAAEANYRRYLGGLREQLGEIELLTTVWEATANFALYFQYGYEAFLAATVLYPEEVGRIYWEDALLARERNRIVVRLMTEWDLVPMLLTGHDICNNSGPMCSPAFLKEFYWEHARVSLEPFVDAGIRVIGHCDGNVMPLIDDMIGAGFSGFQGFQYECGMDPYSIRSRKVVAGEYPLFMAGLSVTRTLPFGTPQDVDEEVEYCLDYTDGGKGLFLFTSNVTGVEVPPENIRAANRHVESIRPGQPRPGGGTRKEWPWRLSHPM